MSLHLFADTKTARAILRKAFAEANAKFTNNTYTEKTTEREHNRRSVCFPVIRGDEMLVAKIADRMFKEAGFTKSVPYVTSSDAGAGYVRVIAYMD